MILFVLAFTLISCNRDNSTDTKQRRETERMVEEANNRMGLPNIINFTEKHFAKMIYELRDEEISTYSYFMDMNGKLHFLCESIGYGLPYSVQYVNPDRPIYDYHGNITIPQPEPNGLFMPDGLSATWVLCSKEGKVHPVYSEPSLIVSPFPLLAVDKLK
jgi:hypothetical protein